MWLRGDCLTRESCKELEIETRLYTEQLKTWSPDGRHILAQYDSDWMIVYQAYNREIGSFVARTGEFGGDFS